MCTRCGWQEVFGRIEEMIESGAYAPHEGRLTKLAWAIGDSRHVTDRQERKLLGIERDVDLCVIDKVDSGPPW